MEHPVIVCFSVSNPLRHPSRLRKSVCVVAEASDRNPVALLGNLAVIR